MSKELHRKEKSIPIIIRDIVGNLHASRARRFNRAEREESLGSSGVYEKVPQIGSLHTMGRVRLEGARLLRRQSPGELAVLVSRSSHN